MGATLIASRPLTRKILILARAHGFKVLSDDESTTAPHGLSSCRTLEIARIAHSDQCRSTHSP